MSKGEHNLEYLQLKQLHTVFKEKQPNVNNEPSKFCVLRSKWVILTGSKMTHSVCVFSVSQNFVLLFNAMDWDLTYRDLIKKTVYNHDNKKCIMHRCEPCPGTETPERIS